MSEEIIYLTHQHGPDTLWDLRLRIPTLPEDEAMTVLRFGDRRDLCLKTLRVLSAYVTGNIRFVSTEAPDDRQLTLAKVKSHLIASEPERAARWETIK